MTTSTTDSQKSTPLTHPTAFPLAGLSPSNTSTSTDTTRSTDIYSTPTHATATCFCSAIQLLVPLTSPGLVDTFICHCADCHKITASMFASNFTVLDTHLVHVRGRENLKQFGQRDTIGRGNLMTNYFCGTCGTLMYRVGEGFPGQSILRIGTVDDFTVMEGALRPRREQFVKQRVGWLDGVEGTVKSEGMAE